MIENRLTVNFDPDFTVYIVAVRKRLKVKPPPHRNLCVHVRVAVVSLQWQVRVVGIVVPLQLPMERPVGKLPKAQEATEIATTAADGRSVACLPLEQCL